MDTFIPLILLVSIPSLVLSADPRAIFYSDRWKSPYPYVGNGYIATTVFDPFIYVQGLYTGVKDQNRRVGIPSPLSVRIDANVAQDAVINFTMNMEKALFEVNVVQESHSIRQRIYCHARIPELAVMEVHILRNISLALLTNNAQTRYNLTSNPDIVPLVENRNYRSAISNPRVVCFIGSFTGINGNGTVCVVHDIINSTFVLEPSMFNLTETYLTVIHPDKQTALEIYYRARKQIDSGVLWARHQDAWKKRWSEGRVTFTSDSVNSNRSDHLTRLTYSSLYYLLSSLPGVSHSDHFVGLSTNGLACNSDKGRIRSEQEFYMFPPLLLLHQNAARLLILSRIQLLNATLSTSSGTFQGAKYPYETSISGEELFVTSGNVEPDRTHALYISGAVAFAVQKYLHATSKTQIGNTEALRNFANEAARFYQELVKNGQISGVISVEGGNLTKNHALTNTLAILSLLLPSRVQKIFFPHEDVPQHIWSFLDSSVNISKNYPFIKDAHSEVIIAHAVDDSIALGKESVEADLLLNYLPIQDQNFLSSGLLGKDWNYYTYDNSKKSTYILLKEALRLFGNITDSDANFSADNFDQLMQLSADHFGIIPTFGDPNSTAHENYPDLPAHGAFLQLILSGYAGFELLPDRLVVNPKIPDGVSSWSVVGIDYQGFTLNFNFTPDEIHITAAPDLAAYPDSSSLFINTSLISLKLENSITVKRSRIEIMANFTPENHWSHSPYLFESNSLPDQKFMPEIGNGHIATAIYNSYIHMNGLYNGEGTASSRARIPSLLNFQVGVKGDIVNETFVLNVQEGIFTETKHYRNPSVSVQREFFAHRMLPNLMLTRITIHRDSSRIEDIKVSLVGVITNSTLQSDDIQFSNWTTISEVTLPKECRYSTGSTRIPEVPHADLLPVTVAYCASQKLERDFILRPPEAELQIDLIISIDSNQERALKSILEANQHGFSSLRNSHIQKWQSYWNEGRIDVDPNDNFELAQTLCGSFYYLLSSLPNYDTMNNSFVGLSPGGLAHGAPGIEVDQDYLGHSFWDTEMWMFPPILFFHPNQAKMLIQARTRVLPQAKENAKKAGFSGAKFPWESALTGIETTPWPPASTYQIHVNGDIAHAVRQFLYATNDKTSAINELGLDELVVELAKFWKSRVSCDVAGQCSLNDVMGPDEYHYPVNNSAYTNCVAKIALQLPEYVLSAIQREDPNVAVWKDTAAHIKVSENVYANRPYHPEFDGFVPEGIHSSHTEESQMIKQADVVLLGYPLDMDMSHEVRENDLEIYQKITNPRGPAMTFGMLAIGYLELGRKRTADQFFSKFVDNIQRPFGVWSENPGGGGAVNFLTGIGGYLQSVINGYGGFRLRSDHLQLNPVNLPQTSRWSIIGLKYLGQHLDFVFDFDNNTIGVKITARSENIDLVLQTRSGVVYRLQLNELVTYDREKSIIRLHRSTDLITDPRTGLPITTPTSTSNAVNSSSILITIFSTLTTILICTTIFS